MASRNDHSLSQWILLGQWVQLFYDFPVDKDIRIYCSTIDYRLQQSGRHDNEAGGNISF